MKKILLLTLLCLISTPALFSFEMSGSLSSDLYIWEDSANSHIRPYENLRGTATLWRGEQGQTLLFKTNLRWTTDFNDQFESDPQFFVYETNLKLSNLPRNSYITLGRQFIYNNAGSNLIDGAKINYIFNNTQLEMFAGSKVNRLDPEKIQSLDKYLVYGFYGKHLFTEKVLFMERMTIGAGLFDTEEDNIRLQRKAALDFRFNVSTTRFYLKSSYDIINNSISELLGRISQNNNNWYYSLEFRNRRPSLSNNSVFSIIDFKNYNQFRLELNRKLTSQFTVISGLNYTIYDDDNNLRVQMGLSQKYFSVAVFHQNGYGGEQNGLSGYGQIPLQYGLELFGSANLSRYKIQDEHDDLINAYATQVGLSKKLKGNWLLRAEWQLLNNAISDYDSRFHFRISKGFSFK